ncbi:membrane protein of unknown function [uncultured Sphingopyxis sp.]|uniref:Major facilitator superfamily (MFS) profile domain-containing protein n=1 Tax=uncultured Sphingopyxis sp. TaxID=310581 RepID=A0A1Y5PN34_9SPHN|nr:membrane protein of unknown function [uncultured Sphingopyxis sp.]
MADTASENDMSGVPAPAEPKATGYSWYVLSVLVVVYILNFIDRQIISILAVDIKADLGLSDGDMGFLGGAAFAVFYALFGIPLGRLADNWSRVKLLSIGLTLWSAMTAASGLAYNQLTLTFARMGVGVGEATASPTAYSLISDYFPKRQKATALAIYSSGLYLGGGVSLFIGALARQALLGHHLPAVHRRADRRGVEQRLSRGRAHGARRLAGGLPRGRRPRAAARAVGREPPRTRARRDGRDPEPEFADALPRIRQGFVDDRAAADADRRREARPRGAGDQPRLRRRDRRLRLVDDRADGQSPAMVGGRDRLLCGLFLGMHAARARPRDLPADLGHPGVPLHDAGLWPRRARGLCHRLLVGPLCRDRARAAQAGTRLHPRRERRGRRLRRGDHRRPRRRRAARAQSRRAHPDDPVRRRRADRPDLDRLYDRERHALLCHELPRRHVRRGGARRRGGDDAGSGAAADARHGDRRLLPRHHARRPVVRPLYGRADFGPCRDHRRRQAGRRPAHGHIVADRRRADRRRALALCLSRGAGGRSDDRRTRRRGERAGLGPARGRRVYSPPPRTITPQATRPPLLPLGSVL